MSIKTFYPVVEPAANFPDIEKAILAYWHKNHIFQKSIDNRPALKDGSSNEFVFYDGPPFANGLPHYGHLLTGFIKDVYARYQTTKGRRVERRFGWDCHGLPVEMQAEKTLGVAGRTNIKNFGIDKFNDHCRASVMQYTQQWEEYIIRQGRWVDFTNSYKTVDKNFMESVIWAFKELYDQGLIYESLKVMPYSWACQTPLSNFETRLDNAYRQRTDQAVTCSFILKAPGLQAQPYQECRILAWTTTPWTLPANLALAVGKDIDYALVPKGDILYILAKFALNNYLKELAIDPATEFKIITGQDLAGLSYQPLFNYFADHPNSFKILIGDFVVEKDGTGIVHMAPGFGEDDQILCQQHNIRIVCPVDNAGKFTEEVIDFAGLQVFDANDGIIAKLKAQGNWLKTEQYIHSYPHCWRTDTPLIYRAVPSWYVKVTSIKDRMVELNQQINWVPSSVKDNLFGKWLENARDWSISRNRFWGTPLPVWKSDNPLYPRIDVYGSIAELEADFKVKITDLHRPFIDQLTRLNPDDPAGQSVMRRVEDIFDCWFESGSMPYGQAHYPFEQQAWFKQNFPADFIVEYSAQTRGWFYTLMVLSTALFDQPPFLNCICHGVILDSTGQKLSKRLNNYADPLELFDKYGADAVRITMLSSNVVKGQELLIDREGKMVYDALRLFIKPIWNAYHFFTLYANIDQIVVNDAAAHDSTNIIDRYILSKLKITVIKIASGLDNFDTQSAYGAISSFFEVLNNWYIRRSRQRFWKSHKDQDKQDAYQTMYTCLEVMCRASSALAPFITEEIYLGLGRPAGRLSSVHLTDFPKLNNIDIDQALVTVMDMVLNICSSALFIRNTNNIRVRQPLPSLTIITKAPLIFEQFAALIKEEINVKAIIYRDDLASFADLSLTINFAVLGKRLPHKIKAIIAAARTSSWQLVGDEELLIAEELLSRQEFSLALRPKNTASASALPGNQGMVILDLEISPALSAEGAARDLVRLVQQARKDAGFNITDHIILEVDLPDLLASYGDFIQEQTLSQFAANIQADYRWQAELQGKLLTFKIKKLPA